MREARDGSRSIGTSQEASSQRLGVWLPGDEHHQLEAYASDLLLDAAVVAALLAIAAVRSDRLPPPERLPSIHSPRTRLTLPMRFGHGWGEFKDLARRSDVRPQTALRTLIRIELEARRLASRLLESV